MPLSVSTACVIRLGSVLQRVREVKLRWLAMMRTSHLNVLVGVNKMLTEGRDEKSLYLCALPVEENS